MRKVLLNIAIVMCWSVPATSPAQTAGAPPATVTLPEVIPHDLVTLEIGQEARDEAQVHYVDLTGDRVAEGVVHLRGTNPETGTQVGLLMIYRLVEGRYDWDWSYVVGERPESLEFPDLDGDSVSELCVRASSGNHYSIICFIGYDAGRFGIIFENGTACYALDSTQRDGAVVVTIGREDWDDPQFSWADSGTKSLDEVWRWSDGGFRHDAAASALPFMTEKAAVERSVRAAAGRAGQDPNGEFRFTLVMWIAGARLFKLFEPGDFQD